MRPLALLLVLAACGHGQPRPTPGADAGGYSAVTGDDFGDDRPDLSGDETSAEKPAGFGTLGHPIGGVGRHGNGNPSEPRVTLGSAEAGPGLDKAVIRRTLQRQRGKIDRCYRDRLKADPTLAGTVNLTFTIDSDGRVTAATATGIEDELDDCLRRIVLAVQFPAPDGGVTVDVTSYPLLFRPGE